MLVDFLTRVTYLHIDKHYVIYFIDIRPILKLRPKLMCILKSQSNSIQNMNHIIGDFYSFRTPLTRTPAPSKKKYNKTKQHLPTTIIKIRFKLI